MKAGQQLSNLFASMHGGLDKFDLWLCTTAAFLVNQTSIPEQLKAYFCLITNGVVPQPSEIVDYFIDALDKAGVWKYTIKSNENPIQVIDELSGHVIEEVVNTPSNLKQLTEKYEAKNS